MIVLGIAIGCRIPIHRPAPVIQRVNTAEDSPIETVLERRNSGHFSTAADVNGEPVNFVVDTGADIVALTEDDARRAHVAFDPSQYQVVGRGAAGDLMGQKVQLDRIVLDGKRVDNLSALVLQGSQISLLGQNYLRHVSVDIEGDTMHLR